MKKSLIAASASAVALAAMPVVGVFATDVISTTDNLEITIDKICSFGHVDAGASIDVDGVVRVDGAGEWETGGEATVSGTTAASDTLSKTMSNGTSTSSLGTTTLGVYCNNELGYTITTSDAGALTSTDTSQTIGINSTISASASGWSYQVAAGTGANQRGEVKNSHTSWANSGNANGVIAGSATSGAKTTSNDGDFFTITYGVGIDQSQAAGTYTGSITYTLDQLDS